MQKFNVGTVARGTLPAIVSPTDGITPTTPSALTCLVIKNGTDTGDSVTISAVGGGRTGVYKWSYDPAAEAEGDIYSLVFEITISALPYYHTVDLVACVVERGTDSANTTTPPTAVAIANEVQTRTIARVTLVDTATVLTNLPAITANWLTAAGISPDAGAEIAALVETYIVNEGDATAVMQAIANLIAADWVAGDASPLAIAAAVRTNLATELARLDLAVSTRASQTSVDDVPTNTELTAALATADDATLAAVAAEAVKTAAIKAKTDQLVFSTANRVDATITGGGGGDATLAKQEEILTAIEALAEDVSGPGADFVTISIKDNGIGVAYANVWITSDANGSTVIAGTSSTSSSGTVRFLLTAGNTYYLWAQKDGMQSINGQSFVAVEDV